MTVSLSVPATIQDAIDDGALGVISHSGGKDSQAMAALVRGVVAADQLVVIHAELPGVDWAGTKDHARATTAGLDFYTVRAAKSFFDMVEHRGMFPSPKYRQCTSDLKRDPINLKIRQLAKARGATLIVNCLGLRAEESTSRARQPIVRINKRMSKAGRTMFDWLPIHEFTTAEVFEAIARAGQTPHWAYAAGMTRLSCCFCIMASRQDLTTAAKLNPDLYRRYVETDRRLDFTLSPSRRSLEAITGIRIDDDDDLLAIPDFLRRPVGVATKESS